MPLPRPYNAYALTTGDIAYEAGREDLHVLYRPLFWTSFMLADWLVDNAWLGAKSVVLSSASSKTAYGAAHLLQGQGCEVVGLTSPRNLAFTEGLGCYDRVLTYEDVSRLPRTQTLYADFAGDQQLSARLCAHLGDALVHQVVVGITNQEPAPAGTLAETGPAMFFAPDQMRKRIGDWGRRGWTAVSPRCGRSSCPWLRGGSTSCTATARRVSNGSGTRSSRAGPRRAPATSSPHSDGRRPRRAARCARPHSPRLERDAHGIRSDHAQPGNRGRRWLPHDLAGRVAKRPLIAESCARDRRYGVGPPRPARGRRRVAPGRTRRRAPSPRSASSAD